MVYFYRAAVLLVPRDIMQECCSANNLRVASFLLCQMLCHAYNSENMLEIMRAVRVRVKCACLLKCG